jgi:hypothetical protein
MQVRLSSRSLSGVLAACLLSPLVSVAPATTAIASPVFDDEHLTHATLHFREEGADAFVIGQEGHALGLELGLELEIALAAFSDELAPNEIAFFQFA